MPRCVLKGGVREQLRACEQRRRRPCLVLCMAAHRLQTLTKAALGQVASAGGGQAEGC